MDNNDIIKKLVDEKEKLKQKADLKFQSKLSTHQIKEWVKEKIKPHLGWVSILSLWIIFIVINSLLITIVIHRITNLGWLELEQLTKLETIAFSGSISSLITIALRNLLK